MMNDPSGKKFSREDERKAPHKTGEDERKVPHKNRVIDFETIRRQKERERRTQKWLLWGVVVLIVLVAAFIFITQILLVADDSRSFWSNFSAWRAGAVGTVYAEDLYRGFVKRGAFPFGF